MPRTSPGVHFPPPLLFALGFAAGLLLHREWPIRAIAGGLPAVGWTLIAAGAVVGGWAMLTFRRARTGIFPNQPATSVVRRGPYRFTRNPMYLSLNSIYLGIAVLANTAWPILLLPLVLAVLRRAVIAKEEAYLAEAFGPEYEEYCKHVRRWL